MEPIHSRIDPAIQGNISGPSRLAALVMTGKDARTGNGVLAESRSQQQAKGCQTVDSLHRVLPPAGLFIAAA